MLQERQQGHELQGRGQAEDEADGSLRSPHHGCPLAPHPCGPQTPSDLRLAWDGAALRAEPVPGTAIIPRGYSRLLTWGLQFCLPLPFFPSRKHRRAKGRSPGPGSTEVFNETIYICSRKAGPSQLDSSGIQALGLWPASRRPMCSEAWLGGLLFAPALPLPPLRSCSPQPSPPPSPDLLQQLKMVDRTIIPWAARAL